MNRKGLIMPYCFLAGVSLLILLASTSDAYAYIDPGSSMIAIQILVAAIVGAMFYLRQIIERVKRFIFPSRQEKVKPNDTKD